MLFRFQNKKSGFSLDEFEATIYNCRSIRHWPGHSEDHSMDRAGEKLKRARERLKLTFRDVEQASQKIAARHGSDEFAIALSRLSDIENKGTVPTVYRLYTLCAIYRLDFNEVLRWYGVPRDQLASEWLCVGLASTHVTPSATDGAVTVPESLDRAIDLDQTTLLSHLVKNWGKAAFTFLNGLDLRQYRYGFIGLEDWSMYPMLHPGSLVAIDESRRRIVASGWTNEFDRPIYFLEHRGGNICSWCCIAGDRLIIQPHPGSQQAAYSFAWPSEIDVIGQVTGVALLLESRKRPRGRTAEDPAKSQNRPNRVAAPPHGPSGEPRCDESIATESGRRFP
jgi:transcriptional regulator with XRE-family HTH domain